MPIVKQNIETQIRAVLDTTENLSTEQGRDQFISGIAGVIEAAIKSATITIPPGAILTAGNAFTQTNPAPVVVASGGLT